MIYYEMQAHHTDHSTNTEDGVMNNFERVQNVNTGINQGMFNLDNLTFKTLTCFQQVLSINKSLIKVCNKHNMLLTTVNVLLNSCGFGCSSDN